MEIDDNHRPTYPLGIWSMTFSHLAEVVLILTLWFLLSKENKRRDRVQSEMEGGLAGRDLDATAFSDLTDRENLKYVYQSFCLEWSVVGSYVHQLILLSVLLQFQVYILEKKGGLKDIALQGLTQILL